MLLQVDRPNGYLLPWAEDDRWIRVRIRRRRNLAPADSWPCWTDGRNSWSITESGPTASTRPASGR